MKPLEFTKMHGAGNDFVVLDGTRDELPPLEGLAQRLCDRHFGIGADQLLVVRPSRAADFRMEIFNPDGSQVEMCANGIRALFKYVRDRGLTDADEIGIETLSGVVRPRWAGPGLVTVDMGRPVLEPAKIPTRLGAGDGPVLDAALDVDGEAVTVKFGHGYSYSRTRRAMANARASRTFSIVMRSKMCWKNPVTIIRMASLRENPRQPA